MRSHPYLLQTLRYSTFTLGALLLAVAGFAIFSGTEGGSLAGRLVSEQVRETPGEVPTTKLTAPRAIEGFSAPADTHVIFVVPQGVRIPRITFLGGPDYDQKRYWGYCYSGREAENKAKGLTGKDLYDGQFFYSLGERQAQTAVRKASDSDLLGILDDTNASEKRAPASIAEIFYGGRTCYLMSTVILPVGIDSDNDELNNARERELQTDPNSPDTDHDGIGDGDEVFVTKTNPRTMDTDSDGLSDHCEDANADGRVDRDETSPLTADSDRDGLCDGAGYGSGCPEEKDTVCGLDQNGAQACDLRPTSPVFGEDMNQNCTVDEGETDPRNPNTFGPPDYDYKWSKFGGLPVKSSASSVSGDIPIPEFPSQ